MHIGEILYFLITAEVHLLGILFCGKFTPLANVPTESIAYGEPGGGSLTRIFEKIEKVYLGSFLGPRGH
jgi:hypothetical protein